MTKRSRFGDVTNITHSFLTQTQLDAWVEQARCLNWQGQLPDYIPLLGQVNPNWFAVQIQWVDGQILTSGDRTLSFVLMSVIKPFVLLFLLEELGKNTVFERVGTEPSNHPFNSIAQLEADKGWPRNPMLNSGAIVLASLLPGKTAQQRCENLRQWLNQKAGCNLFLDQAILDSVRSLPNERNRVLASRLFASGYLEEVETALDTYNQICCLSGTVVDLAQLGMLLVQKEAGIQPEHSRTVVDLMRTCGLYQASRDFAMQVGLPSKSGVSGAMIAVVPGQGAIACYNPPLDSIGNSVGGLYLLQQIANTIGKADQVTDNHRII